MTATAWNVVLCVATILGGISAVWYLWPKIGRLFRRHRRGSRVAFLLIGRTAVQTPYASPCTIDIADCVSNLIEGFWATSRLIGQSMKSIEKLKTPSVPVSLRAYDWYTLKELKPSLHLYQVKSRVILVEEASLEPALRMIKSFLIEHSPKVTGELALFGGEAEPDSDP